MFEEGSLLYFEPFIFPDGGQPKNKYFLVLKRHSDHLLIVALPTSKNHIPSELDKGSGVIEYRDRAISAYKFKNGEVVTDNNFSFVMDTFLYGEAVHEYSVKLFEDQVNKGLTQIHYLGSILPEIYNDIVTFIINSCKSRAKYKRLLR
ncbi:MAG: hypothetical protein LIP09_05545 [Bacteroidales bacterium]|nr:hypothetical protein [Bacteroidales bacterium]